MNSERTEQNNLKKLRRNEVTKHNEQVTNKQINKLD